MCKISTVSEKVILDVCEITKHIGVFYISTENMQNICYFVLLFIQLAWILHDCSGRDKFQVWSLMFIKFCGLEKEREGKMKILFHFLPLLHYEMNLPWTINLELYILLYLLSKLSYCFHSENTNTFQNGADFLSWLRL